MQENYELVQKGFRILHPMLAGYIAQEEMVVATLPIGYYDGMDSRMKYVSIGHKKYEIIGEVCMDMTMIKADKQVALHDRVEVFGQDIPVKETAGRLHTNAYRLLTSIDARLPRVYRETEE